MTSKKLTTGSNSRVIEDPWSPLKSLTQARIGLGRAGASIPTDVQLKFNLDHALARDAVNIPINMRLLQQNLMQKQIDSEVLHSRAMDRREYLQRPDQGRRLNSDSVEKLQTYQKKNAKSFDVALVLVDGLSSTGVQNQGAELCEAISNACLDKGFRVSPVCLVEQGRVAIGDEVGQLLCAKTTLLVVGERPGLSSPDSLGIYFTYAPKVGLNDASRNCISNIRPGGLSVKLATEKALWLLQEAIRLKLSGVQLKDTSDNEQLTDNSKASGNFLLPDK